MHLRHLPLALAPLLLACGAPDGPLEPIGAVQQASTCAAGTTLQGVDVSHFDGTIDWGQVSQSGVSFAFMKATEGDCFVDPDFTTNWMGVQQNGMVGGAYHFFHSNVDPTAQANFFLQTIAGVAGPVLPVLDLEVTDGQSASVVASTAATWMSVVAAGTGLTPILYVSPSFFDDTLCDPSGFYSDELWIADWQVTCPNLPGSFTNWTFWQYNDVGTVSGIGQGSVDVDEFNGTLDQLKALGTAGGSSTTSSATASSSTGSGGGGHGTGSGGAGGAASTGASTSAAGPSGSTSAAGPSASAGVGGSSGSRGAGGPSGPTSGPSGGGGSGGASDEPGSKSGCSCELDSSGGGGKGAWLGALAVLAGARRRRARGASRRRGSQLG